MALARIGDAADPPRAATALPLALGLLGVSNVVANTQLSDRAYVPWNLAVTGALIAIAARGGHDAGDLGMAPEDLPAGLRLGGLGAAAVAVSYLAVAASPAGRAAFADERVSTLGTGEATWQALVRIPLGTVALEELAFRGVLPALVAATTERRWATTAVPAALFGLWHVLPSRHLHTQNAGMQRAAGRSGAVGSIGASVIATTVAGAVLQRLRDRSGHLAAPALVHLATNVLGLAAARVLAARTRGRGRCDSALAVR